MLRRNLVVAMAVAAVLIAGGAAVAANLQQQGGPPICNPTMLASLPSAKKAVTQTYCDNLAAAQQVTAAPRTGPTHLPPPPHPQGGYQQGGPLYGISFEAGSGAIGPAYNAYSFTGLWAGPQTLVFVGSLANNVSQGVVVVALRSAPVYKPAAQVFLTPRQDGALNLEVGPDGGLWSLTPETPALAVLVLKAADGVTYTFNLSTFQLVRQ